MELNVEQQRLMNLVRTECGADEVFRLSLEEMLSDMCMSEAQALYNRRLEANGR